MSREQYTAMGGKGLFWVDRKVLINRFWGEHGFRSIFVYGQCKIFCTSYFYQVVGYYYQDFLSDDQVNNFEVLRLAMQDNQALVE